ENLSDETIFEIMLAEGRRFGISLVLSHQSLIQLPIVLRQLVRNICNTEMFFQNGFVDSNELANEVISSQPKDVIRKALMCLPVGECFVVRKAQESIRVRTPFQPDPKVDPELVKIIRHQAITRFAQPRVALEQELALRAQHSTIPTEVRHEQ